VLRSLRYHSDSPSRMVCEYGMSARNSVEPTHSRNSSAPLLAITLSGSM